MTQLLPKEMARHQRFLYHKAAKNEVKKRKIEHQYNKEK